MKIIYLITLTILALLCPIAWAEPTQQDVDQIRTKIIELYDLAKAVKDASSDDDVKRLARAIERGADMLRTLGVGLDDLVDEAAGPNTVEPVAPGVIEPKPAPEPAPTPIVPAPVSGSVVPGDGWDGPTQTAGQIGTASELAIALWNVVPEQTVESGFTVGVVAHHIDGIDRVEIAASGGPWVSITEPTLNPRTQSTEYWATLSQLEDEPIELRAVAYPRQGQPVVLESLLLHTDQIGQTI
ncbi:MAG: hypothetical protein AAF085_17345, partial [Planctomycetota bacterium]